jgi:hypothetical protein
VPATLVGGAILTLVEGLAAAGVGIWWLAGTVVDPPQGLGIALASAVFVVATGACVGLLAWGLYRARRWSRGPVVMAQLLAVLLGYNLATEGLPLAGIATLAIAFGVLVLVLAPPSTAVFREQRD